MGMRGHLRSELFRQITSNRHDCLHSLLHKLRQSTKFAHKPRTQVLVATNWILSGKKLFSKQMFFLVS